MGEWFWIQSQNQPSEQTNETIDLMKDPVSTVVVMGPTGVGKSLALQQLEVLGFVGVDSVAASVLPILHQTMGYHHPRLAYVLDLRSERLIREAETLLLWCAQQRIPVVYLTATAEILARRQTTTRRRHPFGSDLAQSMGQKSDREAGGGILEAIEVEDQLLQSLRKGCSHQLDTTALSPMELRAGLEALLQGGSVPLTVTLLSFGYKFGLPMDANLVFDIRFLPNPYFVPALRSRSGLDPLLRDHLFGDELTCRTYQQMLNLITDWIPAYQAEQRAHLTVAIGCTGGQHRSVALVEQLSQALAQAAAKSTRMDPAPIPYKLQVVHRHLQQSKRDVSHSPILWDPAPDHA